MTEDEFRATLVGTAPPETAGLALQGLWWDARGDWDRAHDCAQQDESAEGAALHAYLHRKEGDLANARYWYSRARRPVGTVSLEAEWAALLGGMLREPIRALPR